MAKQDADAGLVSIARDIQRQKLGMEGGLPFHGEDLWNVWEMTWLGARGRPEVAALRLRVPADSPCLIESKSLKLYLGSFYNKQFADSKGLLARLGDELGAAAGASVQLALLSPAEIRQEGFGHLAGDSLDDLDISLHEYQYNPQLLQLMKGGVDDPASVEDAAMAAGTSSVPGAASAAGAGQTLQTDLFRSVCPMTGQPDYASVQIHCTGQRIDPGSLLRYLISYREHAEFAEQVTERIFTDINRVSAPSQLQVTARYTRRGGIDINSIRSLVQNETGNNKATGQVETRLWRQ